MSVPTGATGFTWVTNCYEWISKFKEIIVFGDNEHGKITLADGLRARLSMTIKVVRRKDYLGEKDANDILLKYGKAAVIRAVESSEVPRLENVKDLSTVQAVDINALPKIKTDLLGRFFVCFPILSAVRKLGIKNSHYFTNLRTFKKKRLEI